MSIKKTSRVDVAFDDYIKVHPFSTFSPFTRSVLTISLSAAARQASDRRESERERNKKKKCNGDVANKGRKGDAFGSGWKKFSRRLKQCFFRTPVEERRIELTFLWCLNGRLSLRWLADVVAASDVPMCLSPFLLSLQRFMLHVAT